MIGVRMMRKIMILGLVGLSLQLEIPPVPENCVGKVDISIAVPGSLSVPPTEFNVFEDNLIKLFNYFQIGPESINIGLVLYGENAVNIVSPQPYKNRTELNTRVTLMTSKRDRPLIGLENKVSEAIKSVRTQLLLRPGARKIGVIFTYGRSNDADVAEIEAQADQAKSEGVILYALGSNGTGPEFPNIGFDNCRLFSMGSFKNSLPNAIPHLASGVCSEIDGLEVKHGNCFPKQYLPTFTPSSVTCGPHIQPDPNNCAYFYLCGDNGGTPYRMACAPATLFDPLVKVCNHMENVACYNGVKCPPGEEGLYRYEQDCSKFINCDADHVPHLQSCPPGLLFDTNYSTCNETIYVDCDV